MEEMGIAVRIGRTEYDVEEMETCGMNHNDSAESASLKFVKFVNIREYLRALKAIKFRVKQNVRLIKRFSNKIVDM